MIVKNKDSLRLEKDKAIEHLKIMSQDDYPFSVFWKWHIKSDAFLSTQITENTI